MSTHATSIGRSVLFMLLIGFTFSGCGFVHIELWQKTVSSTLSAPVFGGNCMNTYTFSELGNQPEVSAVVSGLNGRDLTYSRSAGSGSNVGNYENYGDMSVNLPSTGIIYSEMTITNIVDSGTDWTETNIIVAKSDFSNYVAFGVDPDWDTLYWAKSTNGAVLVGVIHTGQNIRTHLPYTVGISLDTTTGTVSYIDSLGYSGVATINTNLISIPNIVIGATGGVQNVGNSITSHYNFGDTAYTLTPPTGSRDICGNIL